MLVTVYAGGNVRSIRFLKTLGLVLVAVQSQSFACAEDYVPKDYAPPSPTPEGSPTGIGGRAASGWTPPPAGYAAPPSAPPNMQYLAPNTQYPTVNPQYPSSPSSPSSPLSPYIGTPPQTSGSSGMLQGQVQQTQKFLPGSPGAAPASPLLPGYIQQQGTIPGGTPYAPWQLGNPMQARPAQPTQLFPQATQQAPLQGQVQDKTQKPGGRPTWLPAYAYTNDAMVAPYHNLDIFFWDKRPIPNHKQWMKLSTSVSRYWNGYVPDPCMILAIPLDQAPGNFTFSATEPGAPRGWLQNTGESNWQGFPMYRYWFDQR